MKRTVHRTGEHGASLCGWLFVDSEMDVSRVTCKACLRMITRRDVAMLAPAAESADFPPRLTPALWAASCRGGERRCQACALCRWEHRANLWTSISPWTKHHVLVALDAPRWPSIGAALSDLVEWERAGRTRPSSLGSMLSRIESGDMERGLRGDGMLGRAGELVAVRQALEAAYPRPAHRLEQAVRMALLCVRIGALTVRPTYAELSAELGEPEGELRALVRHGRLVVGSELAARGLVPLPRQPEPLRAVRVG